MNEVKLLTREIHGYRYYQENTRSYFHFG
jgi:hypothetical protein